MASTKVKVKLNHAGIAAMLKGDEIRSDMVSRAERGADAAFADAPRVTGEYASLIHVWDVTTDRAVARFGSSADHAFAVEANHGTLARALDAAG